MTHLEYVCLNARLWDIGRRDLQRRLRDVHVNLCGDDTIMRDCDRAIYASDRPARRQRIWSRLRTA